VDYILGYGTRIEFGIKANYQHGSSFGSSRVTAICILENACSPNKVRLREKALEKIAGSCPPLLEGIDIGYNLSWSSMRADDNALMEIPSLFLHLKKIRFGLNNKLSRNGLWRFVETMADRLVDLRIYAVFRSEWVLSDADLGEISRHCPNLEHFRYETHLYMVDEPVSEVGVIALVRGCPKLLSIVLIDTKSVQLEAFEYIAEHAANVQNLLAVGDSQLINNSDLCIRLGEKIEHFEAISLGENNVRISAAGGEGSRNWY
jgi:hypothetical protein